MNDTKIKSLFEELILAVDALVDEGEKRVELFDRIEELKSEITETT
jgi:hypothetical protein